MPFLSSNDAYVQPLVCLCIYKCAYTPHNNRTKFQFKHSLSNFQIDLFGNSPTQVPTPSISVGNLFSFCKCIALSSSLRVLPKFRGCLLGLKALVCMHACIDQNFASVMDFLDEYICIHLSIFVE